MGSLTKINSCVCITLRLANYCRGAGAWNEMLRLKRPQPSSPAGAAIKASRAAVGNSQVQRKTADTDLQAVPAAKDSLGLRSGEIPKRDVGWRSAAAINFRVKSGMGPVDPILGDPV